METQRETNMVKFRLRYIGEGRLHIFRDLPSDPSWGPICGIPIMRTRGAHPFIAEAIPGAEAMKQTTCIKCARKAKRELEFQALIARWRKEAAEKEQSKLE